MENKTKLFGARACFKSRNCSDFIGVHSQVVQGIFKGVQKVAIKVLHGIHSADLRADVMREAAIMDACRHPHVVQVSPCWTAGQGGQGEG